MACIHELGSSFMDHMIFDILAYNQIVNFDILNYHEPYFDHKPLTITLNVFIHKSPIEEKFDYQRKLHFYRSKVDLYFKYYRQH